MDILQAMKERHSVRAYTEQGIEGEVRKEPEAVIRKCNGESGLHIRAFYDEHQGFKSMMAHYGKFRLHIKYSN